MCTSARASSDVNKRVIASTFLLFYILFSTDCNKIYLIEVFSIMTITDRLTFVSDVASFVLKEDPVALLNDLPAVRYST